MRRFYSLNVLNRCARERGEEGGWEGGRERERERKNERERERKLARLEKVRLVFLTWIPPS